MRKVLPLLLLLAFAPVALAANVHEVRSGETLSSIAARYLGDAALYTRLAALNRLSPPYRLVVGQKLLLPDSLPVPATAAAPTPTTAAPEEQELQILSVSGDAELVRSATIAPLGDDRTLRPGDTLRVRDGGRVLLSSVSGERISVDGAASVLLRELSVGLADKRLVLRIDEGRVVFVAPETPFLTRYLFETPCGSLSARFGEIEIRVAPPDRAAVSVHRGRVLAQLPRGDVEIVSGFGAVLETVELPPRPQPLPLLPGLSVEVAPGLAVAAAATRTDQRLLCEVYADPDLQTRVAARHLGVDDFGVALARFELPPGRYWFTAVAASESGLAGPAQYVGPITVSP